MCVWGGASMSGRRGCAHFPHSVGPASVVQAVASTAGDAGSLSVEHALLDEKTDTPQNGASVFQPCTPQGIGS